MKEDFNKAISAAVIRILRPLIKILLRHDIPYGAFCELAKWVYVDVASREFPLPGKKQTVSRVAIITGLSRKEVRRVQETSGPDDLGSKDRYNRVIRVISGWRKDPRFTDAQGDPRALSLEEGDISFPSLVKFHSGDIPARAVLDEMLRSGTVEVCDGKIRLLDKGYIVRTGDIEKINILGVDTGDLISMIDHNMTYTGGEAFLQRKVMYDNIPADALLELREAITVRGEEFIESMDKLISAFDRDSNTSVKGSGRQTVGLGIYYFE